MFISSPASHLLSTYKKIFIILYKCHPLLWFSSYWILDAVGVTSIPLLDELSPFVGCIFIRNFFITILVTICRISRYRQQRIKGFKEEFRRTKNSVKL